VDTFVIISGDSDFSPLVSKLRENAKTVIGIGVKNSTSDLLIANCDEFIYYDDLVREEEAKKRRAKKSAERTVKAEPKKEGEAKKGAEEKKDGKKDAEARKQEALELIVETVEALAAERGEEEKVWGSMVKQALKRRKPGFNESYYGFRAFSDLLEEAEKRGLVILTRDEKSGGHTIRVARSAD